jgi:ligand-binding sensor domain-containing protein
MEDKTGTLWFGAQTGNMFVYDARLHGDPDSYRDGQGKTFTVLKDKDGKTFKNVWSIIEDKKGNIWFGDNNGLWRYDPSATLSAGSGTFTKVSQRGAYGIIQDKKSKHLDCWCSESSDWEGLGHFPL